MCVTWTLCNPLEKMAEVLQKIKGEAFMSMQCVFQQSLIICMNDKTFNLEQYLAFFQLLIEDGDKLRTNPVAVMSTVQKFLNLTSFNFSNVVK